MRNARMTNRRFFSEWYNCQRCDVQWPRKDIIVHNGLTICLRCKDEPGRDADLKNTDIRREGPIPPLPRITEDM